MSKLISFSLYGDTPDYHDDAIKNAVLAKKRYPKWTCRFYVSQEVSSSVIRELENAGAEIIYMVRKAYIDGMFWRFLPVSERKWEAVIVRDVDCPILNREVLAVNEWLRSEKKFHIMRDHPLHTATILGGLWGAKRGVIRNIGSRINKWEKRRGAKAFARKGLDQDFLHQEIYPMVKHKAMIHSDLIRYNDEIITPFPSPRNGGEFIGRRFRNGDETIKNSNIELLKKSELVHYSIDCRHSLYSFTKKACNLPKKLKEMERESILIYRNKFFENRKFKYPLTNDKTLFAKAGCVVFNIPGLKPRDYRILPLLRSLKPRSQIWVAYSMESAENYPVLNSPSFMKLFDYEMSYRKKADIWTPYLAGQLLLLEKSTLQKKTKFCAAFISSPYNKSKRVPILLELMKYISVDSYGKILQTQKLPEDEGWETKRDIISDYKFTIAFENSVGVDYVTEKLYQPLIAGSVPVYLGAPNVDEFSPGDNAFINVGDFKSIKELAEFMKSVDCSSFHEWRNHPMRNKFIRYSRLTEKEALGRLGDLVFSSQQMS